MRPHLALGLLTAIASPAFAGPLVLSGTGYTLDVWPHLPGGDQYPFVGLQWEVEALLEFEFFYTTDTAPITLTDTYARYIFPGNASTFAIDGRVVEATSIEIAISHYSGGSTSTWVDFTFRSSVHQMYANLGFAGAGLLPLAVPQSFDPFGFPVDIGADSDLNDYLLPILIGRADTISITPAPTSLAALGIGLLATGRRRR